MRNIALIGFGEVGKSFIKLLQIKKDYFDTLNECTQITLEECIERLPIRVFQEILRIFAPLM